MLTSATIDEYLKENERFKYDPDSLYNLIIKCIRRNATKTREALEAEYKESTDCLDEAFGKHLNVRLKE